MHVNVQLAFSLVGLSALAGYVWAGAFDGTFLAVAGVTLAVLASAWFAVRRWFARVRERTEAEAPDVTYVRGLDLPDARRQALELLADTKKFRTTPGPARLASDVDLPPAARELFARYARVETCFGDLQLDGPQATPSRIHPGFIAIGSDTEHAEVLTRPGDDTVYVADPDERDVRSFENYPSVYHLIVREAALVYPE